MLTLNGKSGKSGECMMRMENIMAARFPLAANFSAKRSLECTKRLMERVAKTESLWGVG